MTCPSPSASIPATFATTSAHASPAPCRTSRSPGYHGLASPEVRQRQSGAAGSSSQVGRPSVAAKCATAVSAATTRSIRISAAAVSAKSVSSGARSAAVPSGSPASASAAAPACRLAHATPGTSTAARAPRTGSCGGGR